MREVSESRTLVSQCMRHPLEVITCKSPRCLATRPTNVSPSWSPTTALGGGQLNETRNNARGQSFISVPFGLAVFNELNIACIR